MGKDSRRSGSALSSADEEKTRKKSRLRELVKWKKAAAQLGSPLGHIIERYFDTAHSVIKHGIGKDEKIGHALKKLDRERERAYTEDPKRNDQLHYLVHGMVEEMAVMVASLLEEIKSVPPTEKEPQEAPPQEWTPPRTGSEELTEFDLLTMTEEKLNFLLPLRQEEAVMDGLLPSTTTSALFPVTTMGEVPLFSENPEMNGGNLDFKLSDSPTYDGFEIVEAGGAADSGSSLEALFFQAAQDATSTAASSVAPEDEQMEEEEAVGCPAGWFACPDCDRIFDREIGLKIHSKVHSDIMCPECNKHLTSEERLEQHIARIHGGQVTKRRRVQKDRQEGGAVNFEEFYEEARMQINRLLQKPSSVSSSKRNPRVYDVPPGPPYVCEECNRAFACQTGWTTHMHWHQSFKVQCEICEQFIVASRMNLHMTRMHPKALLEQLTRPVSKVSELDADTKVGIKRTFDCATCWKQYPTRDSLAEHLAATDGHVEKVYEAED